MEHTPPKPPLHVVICGHVDSGKSTLTGRLLHDLGYLDQRQVRKNQQGAQAMGKASFGWAWAMDEREDERARGLTVDISTRSIETRRCADAMPRACDSVAIRPPASALRHTLRALLRSATDASVQPTAQWASCTCCLVGICQLLSEWGAVR